MQCWFWWSKHISDVKDWWWLSDISDILMRMEIVKSFFQGPCGFLSGSWSRGPNSPEGWKKRKILKVLTFCAIDHQEILDHPWLQRSKEKVANEEEKQDLGEKGGSCFKCCASKNVPSDWCHFNPELLLQALQEDFVWWFFIGWSFSDLCCATVCTMFIIKCSRTLLLRLHNCLYIACSTSKLGSKVCALFSFMFSLCDAFHNCCIWSKPSIFRVSILNIKH